MKTMQYLNSSDESDKATPMELVIEGILKNIPTNTKEFNSKFCNYQFYKNPSLMLSGREPRYKIQFQRIARYCCKVKSFNHDKLCECIRNVFKHDVNKEEVEQIIFEFRRMDICAISRKALLKAQFEVIPVDLYKAGVCRETAVNCLCKFNNNLSRVYADVIVNMYALKDMDASDEEISDCAEYWILKLSGFIKNDNYFKDIVDMSETLLELLPEN